MRLSASHDLGGGDRAHVDPLLGGIREILRIAVGGGERPLQGLARARPECSGGAANGRDSL